MKRKLPMVIIVLLVLSTAQAFEIKTGPDKFANISYPATACDISFEEGTIETWTRIDFEPNTVQLNLDNPFYLQMTFFSVGIYKNGPLMNLISRCSYDSKANVTNQSLYLYGSMFSDTILIGNKKLNWVKGQWHYIAITWKRLGKTVRYQLYVDGVSMGENEAEPKGDLYLEEGSKIEIGSHFYNCSYGAIDSFRISSVVRGEEEILATFDNKTLEWDRFTLLLDNFINIDEVNKTTTTKELKKGNINGTFELVDDPPFHGIKLHVVEEEL